MQAKNVLYAAVGAPMVAARKVSEQVSALKSRVSDESTSYTETASKTIDDWATEGEKVVTDFRDGKVVDEISQKVDLDQAKEQVSKLRDQLEDMLATWRQSFRPETAGESTSTDEPAKSSSTTKTTKSSQPAASKSTASKPAAKSSAAETTKSSTAAKKSTAKSTASKASSSS